MRSRWHGEYRVNCKINPSQEKAARSKNGIQEIQFKQKKNENDGPNICEDAISNKMHLSASCPQKRVAVIGAGCCGMTAIAQLKEEGFEPVCFEKTDRPGGTWCYREETYEGVASIMPTTIINHSKEMGAFSNFPPDKTYNNYMRHNELYRYFIDYWQKHDCLRHVRVNMETTGVKRAGDYDVTGRWTVTAKNLMTGEVVSDVFDAVMVCVGHINRPKMTSFQGQDRFRGKIMHTHSLKGVSEFRNQRIVVVGTGCSALDAAVETSNVAKQVYMSTKTGAHIMTRVGPRGYPLDYKFMRRYLTNFLSTLPRDWCSWYMEKVFIEPKFHSKMYSVNPKYPLLSKDPIINDHIGSKLLSGSVIQKGDISHFTENGVVFDGEEHVTEADTIIMATGYTWKFPFLEDGLIVQDDGIFKLYKCVFPPYLKHPTFAVIGFVLVWGPGFPVSEIQSRWVTSVFAGKSLLPSVREMEKDTVKRFIRNVKSYAPSDKMSIRVDYVQYMDEIASLIGARPNFTKLFFTDLRLFCKLTFGPSVPYQYRLQGPHKWNGARDAIFTSKERLMYPLRRENDRKKSEQAHTNLAYIQ